MSQLEEIISKFLQNSTPGSDGAILQDIKVLLDDSNSVPLLNRLFKQHYTKEVTVDNNSSGQVKIVQLPNKELTIVSGYNTHDNFWIDYKNNVIFDYDFINETVIDVEEVDLKFSAQCQSIQKELDNYMHSHFTSDSVGLLLPDGDNEYKIIIVGEKLSDANFYNGKWTSVYSIKDGLIDGIVRIAVHYYEDGNVMLNSASLVHEETSGDKLISQLVSLERQIEVDLLKKIANLNEEKFKSLRRLLPISRSKMIWGKAMGNYKLGQDVVGGRH